MSLSSSDVRTVFRVGNSLSAVLSLFHGCLTLHFANNGNERRVKPLKSFLPSNFCCLRGSSGRLIPRIIAAAFVVLLLLGLSERAFAGLRDYSGDVAKVVRVNDGDTITVKIDGRREKIRLIGIDAPELGQQPWGEMAKRHLEDILFSSPSVVLEYDVDRRDKYGRLLAYVKTAGGKLVNAEMLRDGYAVLFTFPPNVKHVNEFTSAQRQARERKLGIWGKGGLSQLPVDWRRQHPRR